MSIAINNLGRFEALSSLNLLTRGVLAYSLDTPAHRGKWRVVNFLIQTFNLKPHGQYLVDRVGLKWYLQPDDYTNRDIFWHGVKDAWELYHLERLVPQGGTVFDVGANFGYYSLVLARRLGPSAKAYAFEPNPSTLSRLQQNVDLNAASNVHAFQLGLSDTIGLAGLSTREDNSGATFLTEGDGVATTTLDAFCKDHPEIAAIDVVKVDIEGLEQRFLTGGTETLRRYKPILVMELNPPTLRRAGTSVEDVLSSLQSLGYEMFEIKRKRLVAMAPIKGDDYVNVLCIHRSSKRNVPELN